MSIRYFSLAVCGLVLFLSPVRAQQVPPATAPATNAAAAKAPDVKVDPASQAIGEAMAAMDKNDLDGAIAKLTDAINANPKLSGPYVFRGSVYYQKKDWAHAEADFKSALALDPKNPVIQLNVVEMKFAQKKYDEAKAGYLTLEGDARLGDLASYKAFLCDLLMGRDAQAKKERDAFDQVKEAPSYYFSNAAWSLYHKNNDDARSWLVSAANIFPSAKITYYALPLKDLGWLPIPPPTTPSSI
jgi:Flp pilus assembly protein TadD